MEDQSRPGHQCVGLMGQQTHGIRCGWDRIRKLGNDQQRVLARIFETMAGYCKILGYDAEFRMSFIAITCLARIAFFVPHRPFHFLSNPIFIKLNFTTIFGQRGFKLTEFGGDF